MIFNTKCRSLDNGIGFGLGVLSNGATIDFDAGNPIAERSVPSDIFVSAGRVRANGSHVLCVPAMRYFSKIAASIVEGIPVAVIPFDIWRVARQNKSMKKGAACVALNIIDIRLRAFACVPFAMGKDAIKVSARDGGGHARSVSTIKIDDRQSANDPVIVASGPAYPRSPKPAGAGLGRSPCPRWEGESKEMSINGAVFRGDDGVFMWRPQSLCHV